MIEASPFSSLEHATSFARELWFNTLPIQSWLDTFSAHRHIGDAITIAHGDIRTGLLQFPTKYRKKFGFGFVTSTNLFLSQQILEEVQNLPISMICTPKYDDEFSRLLIVAVLY
ncbi:uric acid degradation bifunctional protein TTL-like [Arachis stenosperma]|uniref:uric acid degradation bifunctional protein TTL-like n=1 Tax=Arachis stenosperma TaxID=217475 RepID=UPI0025AC1907|nr:uric acid degradation bifunctional protein TTL-like [Arachis stenosperma]